MAGGPSPEEIARTQANQLARAVEWLNKHWKGERECPICHSTEWSVGTFIHLTDAPFLTFGLVSTYRVFCPVTCTTCFYTWQFDAGAAGLTAEPDKASGASEDEQPAAGETG